MGRSLTAARCSFRLSPLLGADQATPLPDQAVDNATHATFVSHMEVLANDTAGYGADVRSRAPPRSHGRQDAAR